MLRCADHVEPGGEPYESQHDPPFVPDLCRYDVRLEKALLARTAMIVGIGGYSFRDYVKAGLPLIGVSFVICMVLLPILFPFFPG